MNGSRHFSGIREVADLGGVMGNGVGCPVFSSSVAASAGDQVTETQQSRLFRPCSCEAGRFSRKAMGVEEQ